MKSMKTLTFSVFIDMDRETIWEVLWNPTTYRKWANTFCDGSYYKGDIAQGNTVFFLISDERGMSSYVEKLVENDQVVFSHQNEIKDGEETASAWQGAREIYNLRKESDNRTELQIIVDVTSDLESYFNEAFPKALNVIKQLSEGNSN